MDRKTAGPRTQQLRVPTLDPHESALAFTRACLDHAALLVRLLEPSCSCDRSANDEVLSSTDLYRRMRRIADYAVLGKVPRGRVRDLAAPLEALVVSPLWDRVDLEGVLGAVDAQRGLDSAPKLLLAAAFARERLADGEAVKSGELAILAGMTRLGVMRSFHREAVSLVSPGSSGTGGAALVSAAVARRWLAKRGIAGF